MPWRQRMSTDTQIGDRCAGESDTFLRIDQLGHFELIKKKGVNRGSNWGGFGGGQSEWTNDNGSERGVRANKITDSEN